jgi:hypothetical protein
MQQAATSTPSPTFAGMLASLAAPGQKRPPARDLDGLEDDVATISYERALRAHARYRTPEPDDRALTSPPITREGLDPAGLRIFEAAPPVEERTAAAVFEMPSPAAAVGVSVPETAPAASLLADRNLKSASVTIRLSKAECVQLHERAAEAGLTISAYLRSCTFEAESLRAMVKDALAQMRLKAAQETAEEPPADGKPFFGWFSRFWSHFQRAQQELRA